MDLTMVAESNQGGPSYSDVIVTFGEGRLEENSGA